MDKELIQELYQSLILEHSRHPRNYGSLNCPHCLFSKGKNPSCGDELTLFLSINDEDIIDDVKFEGEGCALFVSSTSLLTQAIKNKPISEVKILLKQFLNFIINEEDLDDEYEPLHIYSTVSSFPLRVKCVLLPWRTLENILEKNSNVANTEEE